MYDAEMRMMIEDDNVADMWFLVSTTEDDFDQDEEYNGRTINNVEDAF